MVSIGLGLVLLLCLVSVALGWRRLLAIGFALLIVLTVLFPGGIATRLMLSALQDPVSGRDPPPWCERNALILLGGGSLVVQRDGIEPSVFGLARIETAARAYRACKETGAVCTLLVTGGDPAARGRSEAEVYGQHLAALGVPTTDLLLETRSRNTFENARLTRELLDENDMGQPYLITSATHMRRADLYFRHFGIGAKWLPADYVEAIFWPPKFGLNLALADAAAHEYLGLVRYRVYNALDWNPPPIPVTGALCP